MNKLGKIIKIMIISIMPVLLIIGLSRVILLNKNTFLPTANELYDTVIQMPNFSQQLKNIIQNTNIEFEKINLAFTTINDITSFFNAIGTFFVSIGVILKQFIEQIIVSIQTIIWFIGFLLGI